MTYGNPKESEVQKEIRDHLRSRGILSERIQSGSIPVGRGYMQFASAGHPDLVCYLRGGVTLFIEVKRPGGKVSQDQIAYMERLTLLGHQCIVANKLEIVIEKLSELGY